MKLCFAFSKPSRRRRSAKRTVDVALGRVAVSPLARVQLGDLHVGWVVGGAIAQLAGAATTTRGGFGFEDLGEIALLKAETRIENEIVIRGRAQGRITGEAEIDLGPLTTSVFLTDLATVDAAVRRQHGVARIKQRTAALESGGCTH